MIRMHSAAPALTELLAYSLTRVIVCIIDEEARSSSFEDFLCAAFTTQRNCEYIKISFYLSSSSRKGFDSEKSFYSRWLEIVAIYDGKLFKGNFRMNFPTQNQFLRRGFTLLSSTFKNFKNLNFFQLFQFMKSFCEAPLALSSHQKFSCIYCHSIFVIKIIKFKGRHCNKF